MENKKKKAFSFLTLIGLLIAVGAIIYKVTYAVIWFDSITEWWNRLLMVYFMFYMTSFTAIASAFLKGKAAMITAFAVAGVSFALLFLDGVTLMGFIVSLDDTPLIERGIVPLVNLLNMAAGLLIAFGALRKHRKQNR